MTTVVIGLASCSGSRRQLDFGKRRVLQLLVLSCVTIAMVVACSEARSAPATCTADEEELFACVSGRNRISVCASSGWTAQTGYLQYRFGPPGHARLTLPAGSAATHPAQSATAGEIVVIGGGGVYVRFSAGDFDYVVYSMVSARGEQDGVVVEKGGKRLSSFKCSDHASSMLGPRVFDRAGLSHDARPFTPPR